MAASHTIDGAMTGKRFLAYVKRRLAPTLKRNEIVMIDNLPAHKAAGVREAIEARGATLRYLPKYSPDLNPIEMAFGKLKAICARWASGEFLAFAPHRFLRPQPHCTRGRQLFEARRLCVKSIGIRSKLFLVFLISFSPREFQRLCCVFIHSSTSLVDLDAIIDDHSMSPRVKTKYYSRIQITR
jgi:transposase